MKPGYCKFWKKYIYCFYPNYQKRRALLKKPLFILLSITMIVLSACGGGASTAINVAFAEFTFTPSEFTIPAGQEITVNATNNGAVVHEFVIMKFSQTAGDNFDDEDKDNVYWKMKAAPGANVTGTFTAPTEPGKYQIVCGTPGHYMAGMVGNLNVVVQ
jgi:uncharacterized cupredoxin-like copper-binding protein